MFFVKKNCGKKYYDWEKHIPPLQAGHRKFRMSSVISCIKGQLSSQGMQRQSNQYWDFSLCCKNNVKSVFKNSSNIFICLVCTHNSIVLWGMKENRSIVFTNFFSFSNIFDRLNADIIFNVKSKQGKTTYLIRLLMGIHYFCDKKIYEMEHWNYIWPSNSLKAANN